MALMPSRVKYRKAHRGRRKGVSIACSELNFGGYGLKALENAWVRAREIEAARVALMRHTKRGGRVWIRVFPDKSVSKKPADTRMGKGKGAPDHWVCIVKRGRIMFEMDGIPVEMARESMRLAANKLSIKTKFVTRTH